MLNLFVIMILLSCLFQQHLSTHSAPSFAEIFQSHEGESVLRRSNNIDIYERELALYRTRKEAFPELSLLQIGDDLSMSLPFDDIGGGAGMMDILHKYFTYSHPDDEQRLFYTLQYDRSACTNLQRSKFNSVMICVSYNDVADLQKLPENLDSTRQYNIIIDVNRPRNVHMDSMFNWTFHILQPGGLLIIENLENHYSMDLPEHTLIDSNYQLLFYKKLIDFINSVHSRELGYYETLSDSEKYYASWIKRITFEEGVVIITKKDFADEFFPRLMTGLRIFKTNDQFRSKAIVFGTQMDYYENTKRMMNSTYDKHDFSKRIVGSRQFTRDDDNYLDGTIRQRHENLEKYVLKLDVDFFTGKKVIDPFRFVEFDVMTIALLKRAEEFCTAHRLYSIDKKCSEKIIENAHQLAINRIGDYNILDVSGITFTYSGPEHAKQNNLLKRVQMWCDYFGMERYLDSNEDGIAMLDACTFQLFEFVMHAELGLVMDDNEVSYDFLPVQDNKKDHTIIFIHAGFTPTKIIAYQNFDKPLSRGFAILIEMLQTIDESGLMEEVDVIYVTLLGSRIERRVATATLSAWPDKVHILYESSNANDYEYRTMSLMEKFIRTLSDESIVLYLHTKGASRYNRFVGDDQEIRSDEWRNYMMYFLVEKWQICWRAVKELGYKTCGVQLEKRDDPHYSGNFWWSTVKFLKSKVEKMEDSEWKADYRGSTEMYLLKGINDATKEYKEHLSIYHFDHNLYIHPTPRRLYDDDHERITA